MKNKLMQKTFWIVFFSFLGICLSFMPGYVNATTQTNIYCPQTLTGYAGSTLNIIKYTTVQGLFCEYATPNSGGQPRIIPGTAGLTQLSKTNWTCAANGTNTVICGCKNEPNGIDCPITFIN